MKLYTLIHQVCGISFCATLFLLASCHVVSDQGPASMNKIQKEQFEGKRGKEEYVIININKKSLRRYNRTQRRHSGTIPKPQRSKMYNDLIRPYDKLTLLVIDNSEQGGFANSQGPITFGPVEVPVDGKLSFPYAGEFSVIGKNLNTLQREIKDKYSKVFNTAEVSLNRLERQPLRAGVIGLVNKSGQHEISRKGVTLSELIARSGGPSEEPYLCEYHVHRNGKTYLLNNTQMMKRKVLAQDGDLVEVKRSDEHSVTMMGSVNRQGNHKFPKSDCHLSDFLGEGRGINLYRADATGIFVFRKMGNGVTHVYRFNIKNPDGLINASKFHIHGKDIIYVTEAPLSKWGRVIKGVLPFGQLQTFSNTARTLN